MYRKGSLGTHNKGLTDIIRNLKKNPNYNVIYRELDYLNPYHRNSGEMDVLAEHVNGNVIIFEYKSNDTNKTRAKARKQLQRAKAYIRTLHPRNTVRTVYVHSDPIKYHKIR